MLLVKHMLTAYVYRVAVTAGPQNALASRQDFSNNVFVGQFTLMTGKHLERDRLDLWPYQGLKICTYYT